ncbi:zinc dependent phospholipase C family protein [Paenibacillus aurantiacus]|uniref:Zinc dependent phospholipase C family protein n=1 Tax=Paenibacillus aurantiacus TaxID=1936118 RepID=A0ABV5KPK9_9BACL
MPYPMVHFAIASALCSRQPTPAFLIGSIAPDAVHVRGQVTRAEKGITHFVAEGQFPSLEMLRAACLHYSSQNDDADWQAYILGYFAHIYADIRWTETVYADFERAYEGDRENIRRTYNTESEQVEFDLLRSLVEAEAMLDQLQPADAYAIEPLLADAEVSQYRDIKLAWLRMKDNEPRIMPAYLREDVIRHFVSKTAMELRELYQQWGLQL